MTKGTRQSILPLAIGALAVALLVAATWVGRLIEWRAMSCDISVDLEAVTHLGNGRQAVIPLGRYVSGLGGLNRDTLQYGCQRTCLGWPWPAYERCVDTLRGQDQRQNYESHPWRAMAARALLDDDGLQRFMFGQAATPADRAAHLRFITGTPWSHVLVAGVLADALAYLGYVAVLVALVVQVRVWQQRLRDGQRRRRAKRGCCESCGYDLAGASPSGCPECGAGMNLPSATATPAGSGGVR
jgi:hypothetical protein